MFYFSIQHYYCIAFIAGKSLKNHWEPRCTEMKITLSSVQHTFSVPEKLPYLSWNCKIRTPPISRTSLLPPLQECYLAAVTIFSLIPWYWKLGSPWCQPLLSNASAQIRGSPSLLFAKGKVKRGANTLTQRFHPGFKAQKYLTFVLLGTNAQFCIRTVLGSIPQKKATSVTCISRKTN